MLLSFRPQAFNFGGGGSGGITSTTTTVSSDSLDGAITAVVFLGENVFLSSIPPSGDTDVDDGEEGVVGRPTSLFCLSLDDDIDDDDDSPSMESGAIFTIASLPPSSGWVSFLIKGRLHALTTGAFVAGVGGRAVVFEGTSTDVATIVDVDVEDVALSTVAASPKPDSAASTTVATGLEPSMLSFRPFQAMIVKNGSFLLYRFD
jgi:hypothetical protein